MGPTIQANQQHGFHPPTPPPPTRRHKQPRHSIKIQSNTTAAQLINLVEAGKHYNNKRTNLFCPPSGAEQMHINFERHKTKQHQKSAKIKPAESFDRKWQSSAEKRNKKTNSNCTGSDSPRRRAEKKQRGDAI